MADQYDQVSYIKEDKITRFLKIPYILGVSPVIFQMISYLGAFPFCQDAPTILGSNQMIMVIVIMTKRYQKVLRKDIHYYTKILFRSLAIYDRNDLPRKSNVPDNGDMKQGTNKSQLNLEARSEATANDKGEEEDDDNLASAALDLICSTKSSKISEIPISQISIPSDNFRKLILLLLLMAPLSSHESLSVHYERLLEERLGGLRRTADSILAAFINVEKSPGVRFHEFNRVISTSLPFLFNGLGPLFENFLLLDNINVPKQTEIPTPEVKSSVLAYQPQSALMGDILDLNVLSQLSFFLSWSMLRRLRLLYSGGNDGFSMGSFETHVFNWRAPTILLVSGNRISEPPSNGQERAFSSALPQKRFPNSSNSSRLVFGIYLSQYWRQSYKTCFGDSDTLIFELEPMHEVFHASSLNTNYISYSKSTPNQGISAGCPHPLPKPISDYSNHMNLGEVSLYLDSSFEFGVFTHHYTSRGGAFYPSETRKFDWQDRFEIESLEVWGCGGDNEAEQQKERWHWEEREAEARRRINLGSGDIQTDRALLEMAGILGANMSGGSIY